MVTSPTVIIGVGQAGIRVMSKIDEVVKQNDDENRFEYIAIDSDPDMLDSTPEGTTKVPLQYSEVSKNTDVEHYPYLTEDMNIGGTGAERQRPVGRYKLDSRGDWGYEDTLETLQKEIGAHHREYETNLDVKSASFNIIHIHSLGGGTGSGTFPLMMAMLSEIKSQLESSDDVFYLAGVGVVPKVTFPPELDVPPGESDYYPNAYAALRDLETLTGLHGEEETFLPVYAPTFEGGAFHVTDYEEETNNYDLSTVPFDDYWLVGVEEDKISGYIMSDASDESCREMKNQTIARSIHGISKKQDSTVHWASNESFTGTFSQAEISVPHDDVEEFVNLKEKRNNAQERQHDEIPREISDTESRIDELRELKKNPTIEQVDDEELAEDIKEWLEEHGYLTGEQIIENKESEEITRDFEAIADIFADDEGPETRKKVDDDIKTVIVAAENILDSLEDETAAPQVEKQWRATVDNLWEKYQVDNPGVDSERGASDTRTAEGKAIVMQEVFEEKLEEYTNIIDAWEDEEAPPGSVVQRLRDSLPPVVEALESEREHAEATVDQLRTDKAALESATDDWTEVEELIETVEQRRSDMRDEIDDRIADCNARITALQNEQDELRKEIQQLDEAISNLQDYLTTERVSRRLAELPLTNGRLDELDRTTVEEELTSLSAYVEKGYVSEDIYGRALTDRLHLCAAWDEDIVDRNWDWPGVSTADKDFGDSDEVWYLFHEDNADFRDYVDQTPPVLESFSASEGEGNLRYLDDPYRIEYISYTRRGPIAAFEVFQDYQRLEEEGTLANLAKPLTDYRQAFAYPEWYEDVEIAFD